MITLADDAMPDIVCNLRTQNEELDHSHINHCEGLLFEVRSGRGVALTAMVAASHPGH